ncbi:hypothetical protein BN1708_019791, partial [Verticillium longisporum]
ARHADQRGAEEARAHGSHGRLEQCRHGHVGARAAAQDEADQEDGGQLHWREQDVRDHVPHGRGRARADAAGHARRALRRRRQGHPGLLHAGGLWHGRADGRPAAEEQGRRHAG